MLIKMKIFKNLKKRLKSDTASGTFIIFIIMLPIFLMAMGFAFDVAKNGYVKSQYNEMLQNVSTEAVRYVGTNGTLAGGSSAMLVAQNVVNKYEHFMAEENPSTSTIMSAYNRPIGSDSSAPACSTLEIDGATRQLPFMKISFSGDRHGAIGSEATTENVYWSPREEGGNLQGTLANDLINLHSVNVEVYDASPNFLLGMFGMNCQKLDFKISSITFGNQEDVAGPQY